jgi:hypothetical protein
VNGHWTIAIAPLAGLLANVLAQITVAHFARERISWSIVAGIFCGLAATLAMIGFGLGEIHNADYGFADTWLLEIATYAALSLCFWAFLNLNITSLRIRMLREIYRAGGNLAIADIVDRYAPSERLQRRLSRLESGGQIKHENGRWLLGSWQVLFIARCIEALRTLVLPAG